MSEKPPNPPSAPRCAECKAWALRADDPDGVRRCFGHSTDPLNVEKRKALAEKGRAAGERQRGVDMDKRGAVLAGVVPIEQARAERATQKANEEVEAIELGSKADVIAFLGKEAAVLSKGGEASRASAASAIARVALAALGIEDKGGDEDEENPRGFTYKTTTGEAVTVRGRDGPVH